MSDLELTLTRFRGDPRSAFALAVDADAIAIRAAFMALCKRYHPAKYARCSPTTVRLANETFLVMRRAYDELMRAAENPPPTAPALTAAQTRARTPPRGVTIVPPRTAVRTPPRGVTIVPSPGPVRPPSSPRVPIARPPASSSPRVPIVPAAPGQPPLPRTPASSSARVPVAPATPPGQPAGRGPTLSPRLDAPPPTDDRFERALAHLRERRWGEARTVLVELAASAPNDPRYRAYLHYLRGWEAYELGKDGEARAEWRRALACDPGLGMAKWALEKTNLA
ncbi:MAG: hypothetical protein IPL61_10760 [Myxococcales bacterium]|nr:hypothetical protein [Myxococcales bacterium]